MLLKKLLNLINPKGVRNSPVILSPPFNVLIRIRPQQITQQSMIRNINGTSNVPDLIQMLQLRR